MQRPIYHFTPPRHFLNDPNGLVFHAGEFHLFYQHNPFGDTWGHMSWGHAVSRDLLHWEHLPVALAEREGAMAFSGSAVVDWRNTSGLGAGGEPPLVLLYTEHGSSEQTQCLAYSNDRGRTFVRHPGNPVLAIGERDFRDPKVSWHAPTGRWVMATVLAAQRAVRFDVSRDLLHWTHAGSFGPGDPDDGPWECPDLFALPIEGEPGGERWVLKVDVQRADAARYFVGDFDGSRFVPDPDAPRDLRVDGGRDFYAAQSFSDLPDRRRVWIGWMSHWDYANAVPTSPWRGQLSIPRELRLARAPDGLRLAQRPIAELARLRRTLLRRANVDLEAANRDLAAMGGGDSLEIGAVLAPGRASTCAIAVRSAGSERTLVGFDAARSEIFVDRTRSGATGFSPAFPGVHRARAAQARDEVALRIFVDTGSVEVFADGGRTVISDLVFPHAASTGIELLSDGDAQVRSLEVFRIEA